MSVVATQSLTDILQVALRSLSDEINRNKSPQTPPEDVIANSLELQLRQIYRLTAFVAKHEDDVDKTAQLWEVMGGVCGAFARELSDLGLNSDHRKQVMERFLELQARCSRLRKIHRPASE